MAINFPDSPISGTVFTVGDRTWTYDGTKWLSLSTTQVVPADAGRNAIINGAFDIWQRGTSFNTSQTGLALYTADRWLSQCTSTGTWTITATQQSFTPGTAPVAGYEGTYFYRHATSSGVTDGANIIRHRIEDVRTFAGQTVTISYWAKASGAITGYAPPFFRQNFGSGGSSVVDTTFTNHTYSTSWVRYSASVSIPSITGKTIGASSYLELVITLPNNAASTFDLWGVQLEAGSVATPFRRSSPTLQGELAACQRYMEIIFSYDAVGIVKDSTTAYFNYYLKSPKRANPTISFKSTTYAFDITGITAKTGTAQNATLAQANLVVWSVSGSSGLTLGQHVSWNGGNIWVESEL